MAVLGEYWAHLFGLTVSLRESDGGQGEDGR